MKNQGSRSGEYDKRIATSCQLAPLQHSARSSGKFYSARMAIDILTLLLKFLGVSKSGYGYHHVARAILIIMNLCNFMYMIHGCYTLAVVYPESSEMTYLLYFTLASDVAYTVFIYVWGMTLVKRSPKHLNKITTTMNLNIAILIFTVIFTVKAVAEMLLGSELLDIYFCSFCSMVFEFYYPTFLRLQNYAVSLLVASNLMSDANEISAVTSEITRGNVHQCCAKIKRINKLINSRYNGFLAIFHFQYFLRLVGETPSVSASLQCGEGGHFLLLNLCQLHIFLLVISRADMVDKNLLKFKREVLRVTTMLRSDELTVFIRQKLGVEVNIGVKSVLCWKACLSYLSFCWSFAFMMFQLAITAKEVECWSAAE